jgi:hypothetical protein
VRFLGCISPEVSLSAPNRANTCNSHLGTTFHIFTDVSHMAFVEKHCIAEPEARFTNRLVQAFELETYYACKGEEGQQNTQKCINMYNKGQPNKQNVTNSSINSGLLYDKEHKNFSTKLNQYLSKHKLYL